MNSSPDLQAAQHPLPPFLSQLALVESQLATNATDTDLAFRKAMIERKMQVRLGLASVVTVYCVWESSLL